MKKTLKRSFAVIGLTLCLMTNVEAATSITYTVGKWRITATDLGLVPGGTASSAHAINNLGLVVGLASPLHNTLFRAGHSGPHVPYLVHSGRDALLALAVNLPLAGLVSVALLRTRPWAAPLVEAWRRPRTPVRRLAVLLQIVKGGPADAVREAELVNCESLTADLAAGDVGSCHVS